MPLSTGIYAAALIIGLLSVVIEAMSTDSSKLHRVHSTYAAVTAVFLILFSMTIEKAPTHTWLYIGSLSLAGIGLFFVAIFGMLKGKATNGAAIGLYLCVAAEAFALLNKII